MAWTMKDKLGPAVARHRQNQGKPVTLKQLQLLQKPPTGRITPRPLLPSQPGSMQ